MSELLKKQVDGVMKMKIPEANASPRKVCKENERKKNKKPRPAKKIFLRRRITKCAVEEQWNGSQ